MADQTSDTQLNSNLARVGMNLDSSINQLPKGSVTYALNAVVENFDNNSISYQNEPGNVICCKFPEGYLNIGNHFIVEKNKHIFFLTNPSENMHEIGYMENNDCQYHTLIKSQCLNFSTKDPILKIVHKITNCSTEIFWASNTNPRRFLNLDNLPYKTTNGDTICETKTFTEIDCNKINIQPNFTIPNLDIKAIINGGNTLAGTYQFSIQYCDALGNGYTSYYSVTNPVSLANPHIVTPDFNYPVNKSITVSISNLDTTGYFEYYNVSVIKTINAITSVDLIGTYFIDSSTKEITYSGQNQSSIKLSIDDIFKKYPFYEIAGDVTAVQDILVWDQLTSIDRINYQSIANQIILKWETYRIPATEDYSLEANSSNLRGYLRDEVYPFEIVFLQSQGRQTDSFHIPGRDKSILELTRGDVNSSNPDYIGDGTPQPYWRVYNTGSVLESVNNTNPYYKGVWQSGNFAYWESTETYPCNENVWGSLAGKPIRHHKFPDLSISPIIESKTPETNPDGTYKNLSMDKVAIFPIGVKIDVGQIKTLIDTSNLTTEQKNSIIGFKIVRGDRSSNKSIVAKGILRNVGKYTRETTDYYFANYPYNDLEKDPFILEKSNAYNKQSSLYQIVTTVAGTYTYTDVYTSKLATDAINVGTIYVNSLTLPLIVTGTATVTKINWDLYSLTSVTGTTVFSYQDAKLGTTLNKILSTPEPVFVAVTVSTVPTVINTTGTYLISKTSDLSNPYCEPNLLDAFNTEDSKERFVFNSPETSFGQPFLGDVLKLENSIYGAGKAHFVEVSKNALYKLLTKEAQQDALDSSKSIAEITTPFNYSAMFATYQSYLTIAVNGIKRKNYGWSYNSIAKYNYFAKIDNIGNKQRLLDISQYLIPGVQSVGDNLNINNFDRESSVYLKTKSTLLYPNNIPNLMLPGNTPAITDKSRYTASQKNCNSPTNEFDISTVAYYGSIKNSLTNQWGQIYSYETIDTGFQKMLADSGSYTIFGGDTFICPFSFKTKLPYFIENRVNANDDSDVFYDEIGNVAYPKYWHSSNSILSDYTDGGAIHLQNIISIKAHNFDCANNQLPKPDSTVTPPITNPDRAIYDGKMYMFAYGIPTFYVETSINTDLRQAINNKEGDFYPHVSTGIPDNWLQESVVPIIQDNTYYYNVTYSKQNKENYFSHLPFNWEEQLCFTSYPFRAIYSERQQSYSDNRVNSWLLYNPISYFDFPQNYGKLTSLDGIQNRGILARFENKSLLYNTLLTVDTSNPQAAYLGNDTLFKSSPPIDFSDTDTGYMGSQNKFLLKIPQGQISIDAKRGYVYLIAGDQVKDISQFGSGLNRFFTNFLNFEILKYYPTVNTDNHFTGCGLHGVYDAKYDRVIITKLDYTPLYDYILYDSLKNEFYFEKNGLKIVVALTDQNYFCNRSFTVSYNMNTQSWTSFHNYLPNYYIPEQNYFYSGINESNNFEAIAFTLISTTTTTTLG